MTDGTSTSSKSPTQAKFYASSKPSSSTKFDFTSDNHATSSSYEETDGHILTDAGANAVSPSKDGANGSNANNVTLLANEPAMKKWRNFAAKKLPWFRTMSWYFLLSTNYFLYGETIIHYFKEFVFVDAFLTPLATHHSFISFLLYILGFVLFVCNLQKGHYKFQFSQFAWTHMTLLLVIVQSQFIIKNIFEGLIWFVLPVSLVICNDIAAYIFGFFFGRTPLIRLSPKKTWEGFAGALVTTLVFGFFFAGLFLDNHYMTCSVRNIPLRSLGHGVTCKQNPVFVPMDVDLTPALTSLLWHISGKEVKSVSVAPFQLHALVMALFASLIAPFGGFFASGAKRAFKLKDFGDSIPGHGGITDRMDCQFFMSFFSYMYYQSFINVRTEMTVGHILQMVVSGLSAQDQLELFVDLRNYLVQQGVLDLSGVESLPTRRGLLQGGRNLVGGTGAT
ncbi:hypothetical protein HDV05_004090 [Chytridiales sp. JEL 0842]|nr:hypothetical protein HDV05_004090 [Chytridiales sp. JEL 0842]